jgi:hypothetical protein
MEVKIHFEFSWVVTPCIVVVDLIVSEYLSDSSAVGLLIRDTWVS